MANVSEINVKIGADTKDLRKGLNDTTKQTQKFGDHIKKIGGLIAGAFAISTITRFVAESAKLAGEAEGIRQAYAKLSNTNIEELRASVQGTVSDMELMRNTVLATTLGLDASKMPELFAFAAQRAKETGQEVQYLVDSIVKGIGRKSPLILDNLGISAIALREAMGGLSLESASVADVTAAVAKIARGTTGDLSNLGDQELTSAQKAQQLAAETTNLKVSLGSLANKGLGIVIPLLSQFVKDLDFALKTEKELRKEAQGDSIADLIAGDKSEIDASNDKIKYAGQLLEQLQKQYSKLDQVATSSSDAIAKLSENLGRQATQTDLIKAAMEGEFIVTGKLTEEQKKNKQSLDERIKAIQQLIIELTKIEKSQALPYLNSQIAKLNDELDSEKVKKFFDQFKAINEINPKLTITKQEVENVGINAEESGIGFEFAIDKSQDWINVISSGLVNLNNAFANYYQSQLNNEEITDSKRKEIMKKMAIAEKASALFSATIQTAQAIASLLEIPPLAVAAGALGAAQIATIAATPIPKFEQGMGYATKPTLAMFGDAPEPEMILRQSQLQSIIRGAGMGGNVRFRIEGRDLVAVLDRYSKQQNTFA